MSQAYDSDHELAAPKLDLSIGSQVVLLKRNVTFRWIEERLTPFQQKQPKQRRVYKFFHKSAEKPVLDDGSIRIGTVRKFWDIENSALRDENDGQTVTHVNNVVFRSGEPFEGVVDPTSPSYNFLRSIVGTYAKGDISFTGLEFHTTYDFFIYSFSYECTKSVINSFYQDPFDCVAEIDNIYYLAETLVHVHPQLKGYYYCIAPVAYRQIARIPGVKHPNLIESVFEKDKVFRQNKEGRIVFFQMEFTSTGQGIKDYLERLDIPKDFSHPYIRRRFRKGVMPSTI